MRKFLAVLAVMFMMTICCPVHAVEIPDVIGRWHLTGENILPLITEYNHESLGRIVYRTYKRENPSGVLEVIISEGNGTGKLYVPEKVNDSKGLMPSNSEFKIIDISGHKAIIEKNDYVPLALTISLSETLVVTIETSSLDEDSIIEFTDSIMQYLKN